MMGKKIDTSDNFMIKKETIDFIVLMLAGFIPQPLVAYIAMEMTNEKWRFFWWVILAINALYFIMWLSRTLISSLTYKYYFKKRLVETVYKQLAHFKFPTIPKNALDYNNAEDIYYEMANEMEQLPCNIRIRATAFYCEFKQLGTSFIIHGRYNKAHMEALKKYSEDYPSIVYTGVYIDDDLDNI